MFSLSRLRWIVGFCSLAALIWFFPGCQDADNPQVPLVITNSNQDYLFCFWNVENLFDDQNNGLTGPGDKEYDGWYSADTHALKMKLSKTTDALLAMNGGKGPDILAIVEVENVRAAELLRQALNARLSDPRLHYQEPLMQVVKVGRHIAPAILTRLPVVRDRTRAYDKRMRIIEGRVKVNNHELVIIASHWTSRMREGSEKGRFDYADKLYGAASAMYQSNPNIDILICGDFNDSPTDPSVAQNLHATGDLAQIRPNGPLRLFNLFANRDPAAGHGTHYYNRWMIFDQIVVSPGMLDTLGWSCQPASALTVNTLVKPGDRLRRPWRFGGEGDPGPRGYSDHFPVTVKLHAQ